MKKDYDVAEAFGAIEKELIDSMLRNYKRHRNWENEEGFDWTMWQAEQLKNLQQYKKRNKKAFKHRFSEINEEIEEMIEKSYIAGNMEAERGILEAIKRGYTPHILPERLRTFIEDNKDKSLKEIAKNILESLIGKRDIAIEGQFFKINDRKLNALIKATKQEMAKAEVAMLRKANDEYRKTIFNAQVYANTGSGTYEQCVDMATKDFLSKGINCIEYKNGARVNITDYAAMAIQTANKRAKLQGEGVKRKEWGITTVLTIRRGGGCPKCTPFQGKVFIDDVWSGGTSKDGPYPLLSSAIAAGFYHPNCKDSHTTYFEGISTPPKFITKEQQQKSIDIYNMEQRAKYAERMVRKYKNLENGSLDEENKIRYKSKRQQWNLVKKELTDNLLHNQEIKISKKNINNSFTVNRKLVNSKIYHDKFEKLPLSKQARENVYNESKKILEHRDGIEFEDLVILDAKTGKEVVSNRSSTEQLKTGLTKEQYEKVINYKGQIILLHNHPRGGRLSIADIITASKTESVDCSIVAGHDGTLHYIKNINRTKDVEKIYNYYYNEFIEECLDKDMARIKATTRIYELGLFEYNNL